MNTEQIRDLAIKRHDIDAKEFQDTYSGLHNTSKSKVFLYGRNMVIEELEALLNTIPKGSRVLDVGCGTAHLTNWIKQKGFEVCGIEPSKEMFDLAVKNFPDIEIKKGISSDIPYPDNSFDLIVSFEVMRYLDKNENIATYKEFHRVLKPGGIFFVTQVNLFSSDFYYIFHNLKSVYCKITHKIHHHCNFTTPGRQKSLVEKIGFSEVRTVGRMSGSIRLFYKFGNAIGGAYKSMVSKISKQKFKNSFNKVFSGHLIVIAKKQ
jgi:ubiquinone/menaquinone biosynthesis C-methylase UbiE